MIQKVWTPTVSADDHQMGGGTLLPILSTLLGMRQGKNEVDRVVGPTTPMRPIAARGHLNGLYRTSKLCR